MAWTYPHTVLHESASQAPSSGKMAHPVFATAVSRTGYLEPQTPGRMFRDYGIELVRPALLYCADGSPYKQGDRVSEGNRTYVVMEVQGLNDTGPLSHAVVVLEGVQF